MKKKIVISFGVVLFFSATVFAGTLCFVEGNINFIQHIFQMQINFKERESIKTQLRLLADNGYYFNANLVHLMLSNFDVTTNLESTGHFLKDEKGSLKILRGYFWSNYSLVNYKPFQEMYGEFELDKKASRLSINSFAWGNVKMKGSIDLKSPGKVDLVMEINDMETEELAFILGIPTQDLQMQGLVSGKLKIEGYILSPEIRGQLRAAGGSVNDFKYREAVVNLEGSYPLLNIDGSSVVEEEGFPYKLEGRLNLQNLNNFTAQGRSITVSPSVERSVNWQSWSIQRDNNSDSLSFEYKLRPNQPFGIRFEDNQEILGLEHKIKF